MLRNKKYKKIAIYADTSCIDSGGGATYLISMINTLALKYNVVIFLPLGIKNENISLFVTASVDIRTNKYAFQHISILGELIHAIRNAFEFDIVLIKSNYIPSLTLNKNTFILVDFPYAKKLNLIERIRCYTYKQIICNSTYTKKWIKFFWNRDALILYPPAQRFDNNIVKKKMILSVGRFLKKGRSKRQDLLIKAFIELYKSGITDYSLHLAGFVSEETYYEELLKMSEGYPIYFYKNTSNDIITKLYADAMFYWHACGVGINTSENPGGVEHYGIAVADALAAGCIPIVYGEGGPAEIVEEGYNGYIWYSVDSLILKTKELICSDKLVEISERAYRSSVKYGQNTFFENVIKTI